MTCEEIKKQHAKQTSLQDVLNSALNDLSAEDRVEILNISKYIEVLMEKQ